MQSTIKLIKKYFTHLALIILSSCGADKVANFEIINQSRETIDSVKVSCSGTNYLQKSKSEKILLGEKSNIILKMNGIDRVDGNYYIEIFQKSKQRSKDFGYYSNGVPTNSIYRLEIKNDTILIKEFLR